MRNFEQILRSTEEGWYRTKELSNGTVVGGTISITVNPVNGDDVQFITDISVQSNITGKLSLFNGTAFLYQMYVQVSTPFSASFRTPLKTSAGTACTVELSGLWGTADINLSGYTRK